MGSLVFQSCFELALAAAVALMLIERCWVLETANAWSVAVLSLSLREVAFESARSSCGAGEDGGLDSTAKSKVTTLESHVAADELRSPLRWVGGSNFVVASTVYLHLHPCWLCYTVGKLGFARALTSVCESQKSPGSTVGEPEVVLFRPWVIVSTAVSLVLSSVRRYSS